MERTFCKQNQTLTFFLFAFMVEFVLFATFLFLRNTRYRNRDTWLFFFMSQEGNNSNEGQEQMWKMTAPVVVGAVGPVKNTLRKYTSSIPGDINIYEVQQILLVLYTFSRGCYPSSGARNQPPCRASALRTRDGNQELHC